MKASFLRKVLKFFAVVWMLAGLVLAGLTAGGMVSKALFQQIFVIGFIVFAVIAGLLSGVLADLNKREERPSNDANSD